MCGIAGFWGAPDSALLHAMTDVQHHRGPDDEGHLETADASLGFRRLSIIDIDHGQQPMTTPDGGVVIVYNGEVYNYRELRDQLRPLGHTFTTDSDTEAVLHAYAEWGVDCFRRFNGMWALAILDRRGARPQLVFARDHFGIKPLHIARSGGRLLFASEVKALLCDSQLRAVPNDQRLADYLRTGLHDHTTQTFFTGIDSLAGAHWAIVDDAGMRSQRYWTPQLSRDGDASPQRFRELFRRSVERRLIADVPVGTCLSGGIDSSSIVCAMTELLRTHAPDARSIGDRLKTFTALFDNDPIDEREYAQEVLAATGAQSTEIRPSSEQFFEELTNVVWHVEEPMVSTGPYAQWCVQREARKQVTVLLDGQAGDELLAGYVPYQWVYLRQLLRQRDITRLAREAWGARDTVGPLVRRRLRERRRPLPITSLLRAEWLAPLQAPQDERVVDDLKRRLLQDLTTYSLPPLLRYEDRNSMAHSLEARLPYLDQELVDWVLTLPEEAIIRGGWSRWINREGMRGVLPDRIRLRRKKIGFTTPEMRWLKARRVIVQSLLRSPAFCARKYWDGPRIAEMWQAACEGKVDDDLFFWRVLNVEVWLRVFVDAQRRPSDAGAERRPSDAGAETARDDGAAAVAAGAAAAASRDLGVLGDERAIELLGEPAAQAVAGLSANRGRHLVTLVGATGSNGARASAARPGRGSGSGAAAEADSHRRNGSASSSVMGAAAVARAPLRSGLIGTGDDLGKALRRALDDAGVRLRDGDIVAISEKVVAISQGRSYPVAEIRPTRLARVLSGFVTRTPIGIGIGIPATMQLAVEEAGAARIVAAAAVAAVARPFGVRGVFYRIAGAQIAAIDGPTPHTMPPYNTHAKKAPAEPDAVATRLADALSTEAQARVEVAVVDTNDLSAIVLGRSPGVDVAWLRQSLRDNPMGQEGQSTPFLLVRPVPGVVGG